MFWVTMIMLIVAGVAACLPQWARSNEGVRGLRDTVQPVEGWIGVGGIAWGVVWIIFVLMHLGGFSAAPIFFIFSFIVGVLLLGVGFVLGARTLASLLGSGPANRRLTLKQTELAPRRHSLGTSALITAALSIIIDLANL